MPVFDFTHEPSGETISHHVPLNAPDKERHEQVRDGKVYKRVYAAPLAARDTKAGDATAADFKRTTEGKNVKVGDLWKISAEMAHERQQRQGRDEVTEKHHAQYLKETGKPHPDVQKREAKKASDALYKQLGIRVE